MTKKVGVLLSGCGQKDGSEVHEATCTLLAISKAAADYVCFAPDVPQMRVFDHLNGRDMDGVRNVRIEAARIARGDILDIRDVKAVDFDAIIMPGGLGAVLNLSDFFEKGANCTVHPEVQRIVGEAVKGGKPIGALCIAPAMLAKALANVGVSARMTIGSEPGVAGAIESMGHVHEDCPASSCVTDMKNKIVTTPAYMTAGSISELYCGVEKLVNAILEMD